MTTQLRVRPLDAPSLNFEIGRHVQTMALAMRRHRIVSTHQICECGRLPLRTLPVFGPRCEVACDSWRLAHDVMRRCVAQAGDGSRAVGRVVMTEPRWRG